MKIHMISNMYPSLTNPSFGIFVKNWYEQCLKIDGIDISKTVIVGKPLSIFSKSRNYLVWYFQIFFRCFFSSKSTIHYIHFISHSAPLICLLLLLRPTLKVYSNCHGTDVMGRSFVFKVLRVFVTFQLIKSKRVIVPSEHFRRQLCQVYSIDNNKVFVVPSGGVDLSKFKSAKKSNSVLTLGYVSRLIRSKGWGDMIKLAQSLKERNIPFRVNLAGSGESHEFNKLVSESGLEDHVYYYGELPQQELPSFYNSMDLFVFPTKMPESLGLVGLEAMACGVPVIGNSVGALPEWIQHEKNGYLYDANNLETLYSAIDNYLSLNKEKKQQMHEAACKTAEYYSVEEGFKKIKESLLS